MANPTLPKIPDLMQWWRTAFDQLENSVNTLGARRMESEEFSQVLNQFSQVSLGMQHAYSQVLARTQKRLDMPSRTEFAALAAAVQRLEDKIDMLLPAAARPSSAPRPARTRRPPEEAHAAVTPVAPVAPVASVAPVTELAVARKRKGARA
ncbi:hypothetical protein WKW79_18595 [Variovorax robiniae]|uniref:Poly(3-hydroxyalkanoate) polymerase subunit PhaE n=1 Tax=Variovorax robiniae TaxID=1836199 RepID=A0ABU8X9U9_9BURK